MDHNLLTIEWYSIRVLVKTLYDLRWNRLIPSSEKCVTKKLQYPYSFNVTKYLFYVRTLIVQLKQLIDNFYMLTWFLSIKSDNN